MCSRGSACVCSTRQKMNLKRPSLTTLRVVDDRAVGQGRPARPRLRVGSEVDVDHALVRGAHQDAQSRQAEAEAREARPFLCLRAHVGLFDPRAARRHARGRALCFHRRGSGRGPEDKLALAGSIVRRLDDVEDGRRRHRLAIHGQKRVARLRCAQERRRGFYHMHGARAIYERDPERPGRDADTVNTVFLDRQTAAFPVGERDERFHHRLAVHIRRVDVAHARTSERDDDVPGRDLPHDWRVGPDRADLGRALDEGQAQLAHGQFDLDDHFGPLSTCISARRGREGPGNPSPRKWSERRPRAGTVKQLLGIENAQAPAAGRINNAPIHEERGCAVG
mmetsp:Transcript_7255/g.18896  ORF Transcript_7255/g.18896 Transcript_7255/m.18896 type:complete len:337 (+) Transcript_7255:394-1404(+)